MIILANLAVFVYELSLDHFGLLEFVTRWGVVPSEITGAVSASTGPGSGGLIGAIIGGNWAVPASLVTATFLHGGWMHLLGNMLYLWVFGDNVEDRLGRGRYLLFFLAAGVLANLAQVFATPASQVPLIGASGAVAGVLGAYFISFPRARVVALIPLIFFFTFAEVPALLFLLLWFLLQLLSGFASIGVAQFGGQVAWWAHIGGFLIGILLIKLMRRRPRSHYGW